MFVKLKDTADITRNIFPYELPARVLWLGMVAGVVAKRRDSPRSWLADQADKVKTNDNKSSNIHSLYPSSKRTQRKWSKYTRTARKVEPSDHLLSLPATHAKPAPSFNLSDCPSSFPARPPRPWSLSPCDSIRRSRQPLHDQRKVCQEGCCYRGHALESDSLHLRRTGSPRAG
jgi:hypothetical protein